MGQPRLSPRMAELPHPIRHTGRLCGPAGEGGRALGPDTTRQAVAGDRAGRTLATACANPVRDARLPPVSQGPRRDGRLQQ